MAPQPIRVELPAEDRVTESPAAGPSEFELEQLRRLVLGYDDRKLDDLQGWLNDEGYRAAEVSRILPRAVRLRPQDDPQLGEALAPAIEAAFASLVRRDPELAARMLSPIVGAAIRGAIGRTVGRRLRTLRLAATLPGLRWLVESWRSGESFAEVADRHTLVYRVEHLLLYHRATGTLLLETTHADAIEVPEEDLMEEVRRVRDLMISPDEPGVPRPPRPARFNVVIEQGPRLLLAAVVRGSAPEILRDRIRALLDAIHVERNLALKTFAGDTAPFELCRPMLQRCLEAEYAEPSARNAGRIGIVGLLLAVVAAAWWFWS